MFFPGKFTGNPEFFHGKIPENHQEEQRLLAMAQDLASKELAWDPVARDRG
jgi:hypothetical protein